MRYLDWYHYLNCGYRLPAVAGTDKMGAYMPAGANRVYAYLGQEEFNYPNFAKAVRAGNTFATSGPLLMFHADGRPPGAEITLGAGGGTIEVTADAQCFVPIHRLEVIFNGKVVAAQEEPAGARTIHLTEKIKVQGPGWLAARCSSQSGPTTVVEFQDCRAHLAGLRAGSGEGTVFARGRGLLPPAHRRGADVRRDARHAAGRGDFWPDSQSLYRRPRRIAPPHAHQHGIPH